MNKPKPTKLKLIEGNPGKRSINQNEPKPEVKLPKCPGWLPAEAKKEYKLLGPALVNLGLLTEIDRQAFASLCFNYAQYKKFSKLAGGDSERAIDYMAGKGPSYVRLSNMYFDNLRKSWAVFGLTPSDRTGLVVPGGDGEDGLLD